MISTLPTLKEVQLFSSKEYERVASSKSRSPHVLSCSPCPASLWAFLVQRCTVLSLVMCAGEWSSLLHSQQKSTRCPPTAACATVGLMWFKGNGNLWATLPQGRYLMILQKKDQGLFFSPHKATVVNSIPSRKMLKREHLGIPTKYTFCDRHSSVSCGRCKEKYTSSWFSRSWPKGHTSSNRHTKMDRRESEAGFSLKSIDYLNFIQESVIFWS